MCVAGLRHSPRAAVSPARDGIGSGSAAGRADPGGSSTRLLGCVRPHVAARSSRGTIFAPGLRGAAPPLSCIRRDCASAIPRRHPALSMVRAVPVDSPSRNPQRWPVFAGHHELTSQHDPAHRPAADALDAGEQLRLPCPAAAAVVAHLVEDVADRHVGPREVHLVDHLHLAAAVALDAQEPDGNAAKGDPSSAAISSVLTVNPAGAVPLSIPCICTVSIRNMHRHD